MSGQILNKGAYRTGEYGMESLPRIKSASRYGAIWAHFAGSGALEDQATAPVPQFVEALTLAGYPVHNGDYCAAAYQQALGTYGYECFNYGNADHVTAIGAGFTRLQAIGAKAGKFYGAGASMGTMGLLNHAKANPANVGALVLYVPVLDLANIYNNAGEPGQGYIETAYGFAHPGPVPPATLASSSAVVYGAAALGDIPILILASDNDPTASNTAACQAWAAGQPNIAVVSMGAIGHTLPANQDPQEIVQFFDAHGGRT